MSQRVNEERSNIGDDGSQLPSNVQLSILVLDPQLKGLVDDKVAPRLRPVTQLTLIAVLHLPPGP